MAHAARAEPNAARFTKERYFRLVTEGVLEPDDRVELLEGVVVAMAQSPGHAVAGDLVAEALRRAVGPRAAVRVQRPFVAGRRSVPEPDVAIVPGRVRDYAKSHPTTALLIVEVAEWSLAQDRITKAAIYAGAGIPEYWIVNLRDD
ncbi:MAG: Uma2 family endonuclease, partial [Deltaproteobacteria bacterium]